MKTFSIFVKSISPCRAATSVSDSASEEVSDRAVIGAEPYMVKQKKKTLHNLREVGAGCRELQNQTILAIACVPSTTIKTHLIHKALKFTAHLRIEEAQ